MKRAASHKEHLERLDLAINMEDVTVAYGNCKPVLWDIDLAVPSGTLTAIIGPNNAGKSTLLKCIAGLIKPISGNVYIFARPTKTLKNDIAYVPDRVSVDWSFPTTVFDLAMMGSYNRLRLAARPKLSDREVTEEALKRVELFDKRHKNINEISTGEQQRLLVARALVQDARIYIMDEPFHTGGSSSQEIIIAILKELVARGKTVVVAHHDILTIPKYFTHVTFINGRNIASGKADDILTRENLKSAYGDKSWLLQEAEKRETDTDYVE